MKFIKTGRKLSTSRSLSVLENYTSYNPHAQSLKINIININQSVSEIDKNQRLRQL